jgi:translocator assembly and maintenance protein 41
MLSDKDCTDILRQFPPIEFAFAYGSGVIAQDGYDYSKQNKAELPMLDMIFAVDDPAEWHRLNLIINRDHYSSIIPNFLLSGNLLSYLQSSFGACMWYNAMINVNIQSCPNRQMKYGIISKKLLINDLTNWTHLYAAGRLQKPVFILKDNELGKYIPFLNYIQYNNTKTITVFILK